MLLRLRKSGVGLGSVNSRVLRLGRLVLSVTRTRGREEDVRGSRVGSDDSLALRVFGIIQHCRCFD